MGWELRQNGRRYLYRNHRENGKPVKEYLAADDALGELLALDLAKQRRLEEEIRTQQRLARAQKRERIDELLSTVAGANADLKSVVDGTLSALGYHKHHRGEWRMRHTSSILKALADQISELKKDVANAGPLIKYTAAANDAEAIELFGKARAGDADALSRIHGLIRDRKWAYWLGELGKEATHQLICQVTTGDPVWKAGLTQQVNALRKELLGENPSHLEELLVRRVTNGWIAVHALELELTVRKPTNPKDREYLDRALTRAQKRYVEAIRELARVRRLQAPKLLAQLNVAANQTVVNAA